MSLRGRVTAAAALALGLSLATAPVRGAGEIKPGAYCPLPEAGAKPKCLAPAQDEYTKFFTALDEGGLDDAQAARVESDVAAGSTSENAYLALSSLSYGYLRLAQRAAAQPEADPALVARLERWNQLLASAYGASEQDEAYRGALREAAADIRERAPDLRLRCLDAEGGESECDSTEAVLRGFDATSSEVGLSGALLRIYQRIVGNEGS